MLQKKKGFTLIEVLVVMLIATLMFSLVGGAMVFVTTMTDQVMQQSEEIDMAKNIEKYLRKTMQDSLDINLIDGDLVKENGEIIFANTGLTYFNIETTDFIKCYMTFESGRQFEFILGIGQ